MKRPYRRHKDNVSVKVVVALIVPMLLISIGGFGYAQLGDSINTIADLENAEYNIEITDCKVVAYNGFCYQLFWDQREVSFNDSGIFPEWNIVLNTTIHNRNDSWVCKLTYTISYWNETLSDWVVTNPEELKNLFRLEYKSEFYNATSGELIVGDPELLPCQSVFKIEQLTFIASEPEFEQMLDETFHIKIEVVATYPDPDPLEGGE